MTRAIRHIVIHCSATPNGDARFGLEAIDRMHRERGWRKIGYHYVIEADGTVRRGRDEDEIGAHVEGSNAHSIGICLIGTDAFVWAQWEALARLARHLEDRYPAADMLGHRDYSPDKDGDGVVEPWEWLKTCPGFDVRTWLLGGMEPMAANVLPDAA
ncbi:MAG: N-acetylmuramoyl-L-alanine amidase [Betaproteobacteria bacterium]|nr:MAG: N-acetylmuramoyl-L-alanine amidase [Betaproteobacteria bacterium]